MIQKSKSNKKCAPTEKHSWLPTIIFLLSFLSNAMCQNIKSFTIENKFLKATITNYGATIQGLWVADKNGTPTNVIHGFSNPNEYVVSKTYNAACIGRYAGRLSTPLKIDGNEYHLANVNGVHLHGGTEGFNRKVWDILEVNEKKLILEYISRDGEEGYPGKLTVQASYWLEGKVLNIEYTAKTNRTTVVNLTNHAHFNVAPSSGIDEHFLRISADSILEVYKDLLPTGKFLFVEGTVYDFNTSKKINSIRLDHTYVLGSKDYPQISYASMETGIVMHVITNQPGVVVFTPKKGHSICFETQNFSNAPEHKNFPSSLLKPEETYTNHTQFEFTLIDK